MTEALAVEKLDKSMEPPQWIHGLLPPDFDSELPSWGNGGYLPTTQPRAFFGDLSS